MHFWHMWCDRCLRASSCSDAAGRAWGSSYTYTVKSYLHSPGAKAAPPAPSAVDLDCRGRKFLRTALVIAEPLFLLLLFTASMEVERPVGSISTMQSNPNSIPMPSLLTLDSCCHGLRSGIILLLGFDLNQTLTNTANKQHGQTQKHRCFLRREIIFNLQKFR